MDKRDAASKQLEEYKGRVKIPAVLVTGHGAPIDDKTCTLTVGPRGPILLQDVAFIDEMAHFNRERIPERVVHAKGAGAFGYFQVTHDISKYTCAKVFQKRSNPIRVAARFSTVYAESGSPDTVRDTRGFAVKFYTEEGNWDLVCNNTATFFIRDPALFPSFVHTQKRNPVTHLKDADMFWDFITSRPETTHQVMFTFSDRGIPDGYRHMHGYGGHTFKLVNAKKEAVYCKFHLKTDQKIKNLTVEDARKLRADEPDYSTRDLYNAIKKEHYPSWTFSIQVMSFEQAQKHVFNPFDITKVWQHAEFPLIPVGKLVLNENPKNYFNDVELAAYSPSHLVPGIEPSPDRMLLGRIFSYPDAQRYRLGANYHQIPVNCPIVKVTNYQCDGSQNMRQNYDGAPNYYPNNFNGPKDNIKFKNHVFTASGDVARYNAADEDNYTQPAIFWSKVLTENEREGMVTNIAAYLSRASEFIQKRAVANFKNVDESFGELLFSKLKGAANN